MLPYLFKIKCIRDLKIDSMQYVVLFVHMYTLHTYLSDWQDSKQENKTQSI